VAAVAKAVSGERDIMLSLRRLSEHPYCWDIADVPLASVAGATRRMSAEFISADGFHITQACRDYLLPLIEGEDPPPFRNGLPDYVRLKNTTLEKRLPAFQL
jgi:ATP-dependent phosphofructokinase / diphosphate-dependent phosphofructokinase